MSRKRSECPCTERLASRSQRAAPLPNDSGVGHVDCKFGIVMSAPSLSSPPPAPLSLTPKRPTLPELVERETLRAHRRRLIWIGSFVVLAAVAVGLGYLLRPRPVPLAARFRLASVSRGAVVHEVLATGHLEAVSAVSVGAEISGRIEAVLVDYNSRVRKGDVLARFDRSVLEAQQAQTRAMLATARAQLAQARVDLEQSKRNRARADALFSKGGTSTQEHEMAVTAEGLSRARFDAASAQVTAQEATLEVARSNLDHSEVRAPNDGVVITRNVDPGQTVASLLQAPVLFSLASDLQHMRVVAAVDEADIGDVELGQSASFGVAAFPDRTFLGTVTEVRNSPVIVQDVVSYGVVVTVDNADLSLRPGMTASVRIRTATVADAQRVPNAAFHFVPPGAKRDSHLPTVFLLDGEALEPRTVEPGISDGELTALKKDGLPIDAKVLVDLTPEGRRAYGLTVGR